MLPHSETAESEAEIFYSGENQGSSYENVTLLKVINHLLKENCELKAENTMLKEQLSDPRSYVNVLKCGKLHSRKTSNGNLDMHKFSNKNSSMHKWNFPQKKHKFERNCKYFEENRCCYGERCWYKHNVKDTEVPKREKLKPSKSLPSIRTYAEVAATVKQRVISCYKSDSLAEAEDDMKSPDTEVSFRATQGNSTYKASSKCQGKNTLRQKEAADIITEDAKHCEDNGSKEKAVKTPDDKKSEMEGKNGPTFEKSKVAEPKEENVRQSQPTDNEVGEESPEITKVAESKEECSEAERKLVEIWESNLTEEQRKIIKMKNITNLEFFRRLRRGVPGAKSLYR